MIRKCRASDDIESKTAVKEDMSESYTVEMQKKMSDDSLIYHHDRGMNYAHLTDDILIGSCLQTASDVDTFQNKSISLK